MLVSCIHVGAINESRRSPHTNQFTTSSPPPPLRCWLQHPRDRAHSRDKVNLFLPTAEELVADNRKDLLEKVWGVDFFS